MRHAGPVASENLDVRAMSASQDRRAWARFDAVEFAGEQRLVRDGAVLQRHDVDLQPLPRAKITLSNHQHESGVAFRLGDAVSPGLKILCVGLCTKSGQNKCYGNTSRDDHGGFSKARWTNWMANETINVPTSYHRYADRREKHFDQSRGSFSASRKALLLHCCRE